MNYNLLICVTEKQWTAIDISSDGNCDRISFDGNDSMNVESHENISDFCTQIQNYYNIDRFSDIEMSIKVVLISEYSNMISGLFSYVKEAKNVSIIDVKDIIPIYVLKNCIVKPGSVIDVRCLGCKYTLFVDENLVVSYINDKAGEEILIQPENFSILFLFDCKNLISDENELKELEERYNKEVKSKQKEIVEQKKKYDELKKKYNEIEACYTQLQKEVEESRTKFDDKRIILRFDKNQLKENASSSFPYGGLFSAFSVASAISTSALSSINKKYICKLLKADGEIVKKGTSLIEIVESISLSDNTPHDTGKKCTIKASTDGRVFYIVKNDDVIKDNDAVVLLSDSADKKSDIMQWYKEMK